ncbi:MAG: UDP-N-acetylmuramate dehydrogenase [Mangrovibacterium sp.]
MVCFLKNCSLRSYNTFGLDSRASYYFEFTEEEDLPVFLAHFEGWEELPLLFLGGGSNLLFAADYPGLVIHARLPGIRTVREDRYRIWLEAGAGVEWDDFVEFCVRSGYGGAENLSLIPGYVGAAPVQNIGAYGAEAAELVERVRGFDMKDFTYRELVAEECRFAYRDSIFKGELKGRFVVTSVVFRLDKFPQFRLDYGDLRAEAGRLGRICLGNVREAVVAIRRRKLPDPLKLGNAGSFFKNPVVSEETAGQLKEAFPDMPVYQTAGGFSKLAAGWLIEQCGWKGYREGEAGVHEDQALVLVNYGKATGCQLLSLADKIRESVYRRFAVELEPEVLIV